MHTRQILAFISFFLCGVSLAANSVYCPENRGFINTGMSQQQVINACGAPAKKEQSARPATTKVPMTQLFYNQSGSPSAFYGHWNIPTGTNSGTNVEIDVINDKVSAIRLNGSSSNALSICSNTSIQAGDPIQKVYSACGNPSNTNKTFVNQPMQGNPKPEIWTYTLDPYQNTSMRLTFVNGRLQSIDQ